MTNQQQLTDEQKDLLEKQQHIRSLNNARSKNYYQRHRPEILEKEKLKRQNTKKKLEEIAAQMAITSIDDTELELDYDDIPTDDFNDLNNEVITHQTKVKDYIKKRDYTQEDLINIVNNTDWIFNTKSTYISAIKRIFKAGGCKTLKPCLNDMNKFVKTVNEDKILKYGTSSKTGTYQILGKLFDKFQIGEHMFNKKKETEIKTVIEKEHKRWKFENETETKNKKKNNTVPNWKDYLSKTKTNFGEESKEYLIAYLYSNLTLRDNFKEMTIVKTMNETSNPKFNYFVLTSNNKMTFVINRFKTDKKYNKLVYKVEIPTLKKLLKKWIEKNKLQYGKYLFGKSSLSSFVSKINKSNNYSYNEGKKSVGGINFLRHITASAIPNSDYEKLSFDEREALANSMLHSMATNEKYRYNLNIIEL